MTAGPIIQVEGLSHAYEKVPALTEVSFDVVPGEMFGLIGPDGAGKTTTLRSILGLLHPDAGRIQICGLDPKTSRAALSRKVGYFSQRFSLYGDLSIDENMAFFAAVHEVSGWRERRDKLLETLRLSEFRDRLASKLSGGMKQKLALACTLIHTPELIVMDEPTTGVDPVSRREFWRILGRLQTEGITILLTTPYLDEAERCQRVALLNRGRILMMDTPPKLRGRFKEEIVELTTHPRRQAIELLKTHPRVRDIQTFGEKLHVTLNSPSTADAGSHAAELSKWLSSSGFSVQSARTVTPSLEDVFIKEATS